MSTEARQQSIPPIDHVRLYLHDIGESSLLSLEKQIELSKKIEKKVLLNRLEEKLEEKSDLSCFVNNLYSCAEGSMRLSDNDKENLRHSLIARQIIEDMPDCDQKEYLDNLKTEGETAKKELIEANLRLVVSVAKKHIEKGLSFLDIIQEGNIGLMKAAEKFDWRVGCHFSTYATWWIRQTITRGIMEQSSPIRGPVHVWEQIYKMTNVEHKLINQHGRKPTPLEVACELGWSENKVNELSRILTRPLSLDRPVADGSDDALGNFIEDHGSSTEEIVSRNNLKDDLLEAIGKLTPRERMVLRMRFGLDDGQRRTLDEVGREFKVTRERIRQIEVKALKKLRHPSRREKLKEYL